MRLPTIPTSRRAFAQLGASIVLYRLWIWFFYLRHAERQGDEFQYSGAARGLWRTIRGVESPPVIDTILRRGFFPQGTGVSLIPALAISENVAWLRLYSLMFASTALLLSAMIVRRAFGARVAFFYLAFVGFVPLTAIGSSLILSQSVGMALVVAFLAEFSRALESDFTKTRHVASSGVLLGTGLHFRPQYIALVLVVLVIGFVWLRMRQLSMARLLSPILVGVLGVGIFAPWMVALSHRSEGFVLTTHTVDMKAFLVFSDQETKSALYREFRSDTPNANAFGTGTMNAFVDAEPTSWAQDWSELRQLGLADLTIGNYLPKIAGPHEDFWNLRVEFWYFYDGPRTKIEGTRADIVRWSTKPFVYASWFLIVAGLGYSLTRFHARNDRLVPAPLLVKAALLGTLIQPYMATAQMSHFHAVVFLAALLIPLSLWPKDAAAARVAATGSTREHATYRSLATAGESMLLTIFVFSIALSLWAQYVQ